MEYAKKKLTEKEAFDRLSNICARAEYCRSDMLKKMMKWELPDGAEERILRRLEKERYIDENRYAHAFVRSKFRFNRWGSAKITRELKMKGIDEEDIMDAMNEIDEEESQFELDYSIYHLLILFRQCLMLFRDIYFYLLNL